MNSLKQENRSRYEQPRLSASNVTSPRIARTTAGEIKFSWRSGKAEHHLYSYAVATNLLSASPTEAVSSPGHSEDAENRNKGSIYLA